MELEDKLEEAKRKGIPFIQMLEGPKKEEEIKVKGYSGLVFMPNRVKDISLEEAMALVKRLKSKNPSTKSFVIMPLVQVTPSLHMNELKYNLYYSNVWGYTNFEK